MFISKKGPHLRRSTGFKINAKGDNEVVTKEEKTAETKKKDIQPKKDTASEEKKEDAAK